MLEELRRRTARSGLDIVLVDVWEGADSRVEAQRYCDMWGIEATVLLDETAEYTRALGIRGVPTNVFVDAGGIVQAVGAATPAELEREIARLAPEAGRLLGIGPGTTLAEEGRVRGPLV